MFTNNSLYSSYFIEQEEDKAQKLLFSEES